MPAGKISDSEILRKSEYLSILKLLRYCNAVNYDTGLTHGQLLYALSEKPEMNIEHHRFFENIEKSPTNVFKKSFASLYETKNW